MIAEYRNHMRGHEFRCSDRSLSGSMITEICKFAVICCCALLVRSLRLTENPFCSIVRCLSA